jgi:hypothetical protein
MPDETRQPRTPLTEWVGSWVSIIAPISVLSALLFYFGYVSSRAQYEYFGIDVDTIGLNTQDYIMRSPQPLLVPLLAIAFLGSAGLVTDAAIRRRVTRAAGSPRVWAARSIRLLTSIAKAAGVLSLAAGIVLLTTYTYFRSWWAYSLITPTLIGTGTAMAVYAARTSNHLREQLRLQNSAEPNERQTDAVQAESGPTRLLRGGTVMSYLLIAASLFWTTATLAEWTGRGRAQDQAQQLDRLPRVILDTKERLFLRSPGIEETSLPTVEGQTFRYRYRNLRLLIVGGDRMFLVPEQWSASNTTLIVPIDESVRVQFQFQNQQP